MDTLMRITKVISGGVAAVLLLFLPCFLTGFIVGGIVWSFMLGFRLW